MFNEFIMMYASLYKGAADCAVTCSFFLLSFMLDLGIYVLLLLMGSFVTLSPRNDLDFVIDF